jgi:hypothetical protein
MSPDSCQPQGVGQGVGHEPSPELVVREKVKKSDPSLVDDHGSHATSSCIV